MKRYFLFILLSCCVWGLKAQDFKLVLQTGYGFYDMSSFSKITQKNLSRLAFNAKVVSDYPPCLYYQPMLVIPLEYVDFGIAYLNQTTGSRISSKDYSGEYHLDTKLSCNSPAIFFGRRLAGFKLFRIDLSLLVGMNISNVKVEEFLQVGTEQHTNDYKFSSSSGFFKPSIDLLVPWRRFSLGLNCGYLKEFVRKDYIQLDSNNNKLITQEQMENIDLWDGFRLGLSLSYAFSIKPQK